MSALKKLALGCLLATVVACSSNKESSNSEEEAIGQGGGVASTEKAADMDPRDSVRVPDRVFFAYDSSEILSEARDAIADQASFIKASKVPAISIEGHCDERGTREYNMALGNRRANAAKAELVRNGVPSSSIKAISYGKDRPAVMGDSESAHQQNRRAVLVVG